MEFDGQKQKRESLKIIGEYGTAPQQENENNINLITATTHMNPKPFLKTLLLEWYLVLVILYGLFQLLLLHLSSQDGYYAVFVFNRSIIMLWLFFNFVMFAYFLFKKNRKNMWVALIAVMDVLITFISMMSALFVAYGVGSSIPLLDQDLFLISIPLINTALAAYFLALSYKSGKE